MERNMPELPIFNATDPKIIPAKVYDKIWIEEIVIRAPDPNGDVYGEVKLSKYGIFEGVAELSPEGGQWVRVENMLSKADSDNDLQVAISALLAYVGKVGVENNIISNA